MLFYPSQLSKHLMIKTLKHNFAFCTMTNECTIISQITTLIHISTHSYHPQGAYNQYLAKLHKYEGWNFNGGNYLFTTDTK